MRIISSVHEIDAQQTGELDENTVGTLRGLIDQACSTPERESYCADKIGQRTFEVVLASYTAPDGQDRWAVYTSDNMGAAYLDTGDNSEAVARYEDEARTMADCADQTMYAWWDCTDVDGLRQNGHLYDLDARTGDDEDWERIEQGHDVLGDSEDYEDLEAAAGRLVEERLGNDPRGYAEARVTFWTHSRADKAAAVEIVEVAGE